MSPATGRLDAFEWKTPMGRVQPLIEAGVLELEPDMEDVVMSEPVPAPISAEPAAVTAKPAQIEAAPGAQPPATDRLQYPPDDPGVKAEYLNGRPKSRFRLF
jgi:HemY protein